MTKTEKRESDRQIVSVKNLSHRYAKDWAVRDVSFDICKTGVVGLLGSNGAGKSTVMNSMCGVLYPTIGDVLIEGCSIRRDPLAAKERIGFLPQQPPLYPDLTVDEYLTYCASLRRLPPKRIPKAVEEAKLRCGIMHFSKRLIGALSGGYRQRCGIAQAILHAPSLVVMDEPTNGLDPIQILAVRKLIKEIGKNHTVLLSTHILPEVEALCDEIKMIEQGRIVFEGALDAFASVVEPHSLIAIFGNPPPTNALPAIAGVKTIDRITQTKWRIHFEPGADISPAIIAASVQNGWALKEIHLEHSSLETVFARLAEEDAAEAKAA